MKLLVVTNDFPPRVGGIQTYVSEILARLDDEITVVSSTSPGAAEFDATYRHRVVRVPTSMLLPTPAVRARVAALVENARPDIILFGAAMPLAALGPPLRRRFGVPYAAFTHGLEIAAARVPLARTLLHRITRDAALVTAVSAWTAAVLEPHMPDPARLAVLPNGVDTTRFHPSVSDVEIRARHHLGTARVVGCISRLVRRKGQDRVIRALAEIGRFQPDVRGLIVGSGPCAQRLQVLAASAGIADRVVFTGEVPERDLPMYFRAAQVFAMPCRSRWAGLEVEAFGGAYLQAAAVGRPVVAGRSGGTADALIDGETGVLVDGSSQDEVTGAIRGLLDDSVRAAAMGSRGAAWVSTHLAWDQIAMRGRALLVSAIASA